MLIKGAKKLYKNLKNPWWKAKKKYIKFYEELPIDDSVILIESQHGTEMNGNVFYLLRYLSSSEKYSGFTIYLSTRLGKKAQFQRLINFYGLSNVKILVLASEEYYKVAASAKYLFNDNTFLPFFMKKEGQIYVNTWHGTPLKSLGRQVKTDAHAIGNAQRNFLFADYITFPNEHTKDAILKDYMVENISRGSYIMAGYPRNEILFDTERRTQLKEELHLSEKKIYAYMPTFRGSAAKGGTSKNTFYLNYFLYELDSRLEDDELLYVNLHPVAKKDVDFKAFKHIRNFPVRFETYDFLNLCDVLISDYSSVFFDYASSQRKVVLFTYDKEEYLRDRGMYLSIDDLPFPQVYDVQSLVNELRSEKNYDDTEFLKKFCKYEGCDTSQKICDYIILGEKNGLEALPVPCNDKENVLIYSGNLAGNGITASLMSLLNTIDLNARNYYITFRAESVYKNRKMLEKLPEGVFYIATADDMNLTIKDHIVRALFKAKKISAKSYMKKQSNRVREGFVRNFADAKFNSVIQFNGYEPEIILQFSTFPGKKSIFVHSDMLKEIKTRGNQRFDVLNYAYNVYDNVATVTEDIIPPTLEISGKNDNIKIVKNSINYRSILEKSELELERGAYSKCTVDYDTLTEILNAEAIKFINVGRFSPEKGQDRLIRAFAKFHENTPDSYLIIIGGSSYAGVFDKLKALIAELSLEDRVILILNMPNPYNLLAKCDYFILSSLYEGFGLVLAEADILGLPIISTDIDGPRTFMNRYGGKLVENSEEGILQGMKLLANGEVSHIGVDYEQYNNEVRAQFESLF